MRMTWGTSRKSVLAALLAVVVLVPAVAGARSVDLGRGRKLEVGNGRADYRNAATVLPGTAVTTGRLLQLYTEDPVRGSLPVDLGVITAEAARNGTLVSELYLEGMRAGDQELPNVAYHETGETKGGASSNVGRKDQENNQDFSLELESNVFSSQLGVASWRTVAGRQTGALSSLDALSGSVTLKPIRFRADMGERGFASEVGRHHASARFAVTLEDLHVQLGSILPAGPLPLGTSLDMITRLEVPLADDLAVAVARTMRLVEQLGLIEDVLHRIDEVDDAIDDATDRSPAARAALDALDAAEADAVAAANALSVALGELDAAEEAAELADAALADAEDALDAAEADLADAQDAVDEIDDAIAAIEDDIAGLEAEEALADPLRLLEIADEIAEREAERADRLDDLETAEQTRDAVQDDVDDAAAVVAEREAAADAAADAVDEAQAEVDAKRDAVAAADADVLAAEAAADAATAGDGVPDALEDELDALTDDLEIALQGVADLLDSLPPLPVLEEDLDEALRAAPLLRVGGLALETAVRADASGSTNSVHCTVHEVQVLGYVPEVEECTDLIAAEKEAVARVNELLQALGAIGVDGVRILGPHGTWSQPGGPGADGIVRSHGQMSALTLEVPKVRLDGVATNALGDLGGILATIRDREASRLMLPLIAPLRMPEQRYSALAAGPDTRSGEQVTVGRQLEELEDGLDDVGDPDVLDGASTGAVRVAIAQAETEARFDTTFDRTDPDPVDPDPTVPDPTVPDPDTLCGGNASCLAACAAGQCPASPISDAIGGGSSAEAGSAADAGRDGGDDEGLHTVPVNDVQPGSHLPHTGAAGGLAALGLLGLGSVTGLALRRRPTR